MKNGYNCKEARTSYKEFNNIRRALGHKPFWLKTKMTDNK
jgi:hypothetical protein